MPYVIAQPCIEVKNGACVEAFRSTAFIRHPRSRSTISTLMSASSVSSACSSAQ